MAQEIVVWCDRHLKRDGARVDGITRRISLEGKEIELDACEECWAELAAPLIELLDIAGRPVVARRNRKRKSSSAAEAEPPALDLHGCEIEVEGKPCGRTFSTAHGLRMHRQRAHEGKW